MAFVCLINVGHAELSFTANALAICVSQSAALLLTGIASLGQIGYLLEILLGITIIGTGVAGTVRCFWCGRDLGICWIDKTCDSSIEGQPMRDENSLEREVEITIRLEAAFSRVLHRQRCIVTIRGKSGSAKKAGREIWYARDQG